MLEDPILKHTLIAVIIIVGAGIIGRLVKSVLEVIFKKIVRNTATTLDDRILPILCSYVVPVSIVSGFAVGIREVRKALTAEQTTHQQILDYLSVLAFVVFVLLIARLISRLLKGTAEWYMEGLAMKTQRTDTGQVAPLLMKFVNILLFFIAGLIVLDHVGINIGSLLVSLGIGSLAIALAAQETLSNVIGWFVILLDQPFRVGDQIRLTSGEEGRVYQIGLRATRILNAENNLVIVPNGEIAKSRIVNISLPDATTRLTIDMSVPYSTDLENVRTELLKTAQQHPDVLQDLPPEVTIVNFGDAGILVRLTAHVYHGRKAVVESGLREQIARTFKDNGIEVSPSRVIHFVYPHESQASQTL